MNVTALLSSPEVAVNAVLALKEASVKQEAAVLTFKKALDMQKQNASAMLQMVTGGKGGRLNTYA